MENFKNIKKKNSFLGEYTKVYKDELQAIGAMGIFIGITFFNYYWTIPYLFEEDSSFKSIFMKVAFSILLTTLEIASVCFAALMIIAIEGLISNIVYGIKRVNRLTYLPLTKEEAEKTYDCWQQGDTYRERGRKSCWHCSRLGIKGLLFAVDLFSFCRNFVCWPER